LGGSSITLDAMCAPPATLPPPPAAADLTTLPPATATAGPAAAPTTNLVSEVAGHPALANGYANLPLAFEPNLGQTDPRVQYMARGPGFNLFLTGDGAVLSLARSGHSGLRDVLKLQFTGTSPSAQLVGQQQLPGRSNYFASADPSTWHTDVPQFAQVATHNLYPGIDARYYSGIGDVSPNVLSGTDLRAK
jgi:hypothetical protein